MAKKDEKLKRINIALNLANKEDREVYNILVKKGNMSWYIRKAVLQFHKGSRLDLQTAEDIRKLIMETIQDTLGTAIPKMDQAGENELKEKTSATELAEEESDLEEKQEENQNKESEDDILDDNTMEAISKMF